MLSLSASGFDAHPDGLSVQIIHSSSLRRVPKSTSETTSAMSVIGLYLSVMMFSGALKMQAELEFRKSHRYRHRDSD